MGLKSSVHYCLLSPPARTRVKEASSDPWIIQHCIQLRQIVFILSLYTFRRLNSMGQEAKRMAVHHELATTTYSTQTNFLKEKQRK